MEDEIVLKQIFREFSRLYDFSFTLAELDKKVKETVAQYLKTTDVNAIEAAAETAVLSVQDPDPGYDPEYIDITFFVPESESEKQVRLLLEKKEKEAAEKRKVKNAIRADQRKKEKEAAEFSMFQKLKKKFAGLANDVKEA